jgi:Holliday junction resolvase RusA-like endonuclease
MTERTVFWVSIPMPPSLNNVYVTNRTTGRRFLSKVGKAFKDQAGWTVREQVTACEREGIPLAASERYGITLFLYFGPARKGQRRDVSNRIKVAEDAVMEALGVDDSYISEVHAYLASENATDPHCMVRVEALSGELRQEVTR